MKNIPYYFDRPISNLRQMLYESCEIYKDNVAYLSKNKDKQYEEIKYSQVLNDVNALGTAFINLGLKNKKIALIGENRYEWSISYLSVICGTGIIVPLDKQLPEVEIENCLRRAEVSAIIYSDKIADKIERIMRNVDTIEYYMNMGIEENSGDLLSLHKLLEKGSKLVEDGDKSFTETIVDETTIASLLFTSGTTSESKAVMLSHKNLAYNIENMTKLVKFVPEDRMLSILPIHHTYECTCGFLMPIYKGLSVAYCEGLKHIASNMKEAKPTILLGVPLIVENLYNKVWQGIESKGKTNTVKTIIKITNAMPEKLGNVLKRKLFKDIHENLGGKLNLMVAGAAAVNPEVSKGFRDFGILAIQGYGLTETSPILAVNRQVDYKDAAVGLPLPGTEVKIDEPNDEGVGEIICKGEHVMLGYYKNQEATAELLKDGWFHTGDLGYIDKDGFIYVSGRKKNVIITKNGKNIYPEELEVILNENIYIKESMVYGKNKDNLEDIVISAALFLDKEYIDEKFKDVPKTDEEIKAIVWEEVKRINEKLVSEKHIKEISIRDKEFEKTTTMKIKRYLEMK